VTQTGAPAPGAARQSSEARERILEATYACIGEVGLSKVTIEDAARRAGLSRATVYRHFPGGKDELMRAAVAWEARRFFTRLAEEVSGAPDMSSLLQAALVHGQEAVEGHQVLQKVLHTEPDVLMRQLTFEGTRILSMIRSFLERFLAPASLPAGITMEQASDYLARMVLSHITAPGSWDLSDPEKVKELVDTQILGWLVAGRDAGETAP
jgi:AcrR family transcriptional regulator